jgi:hypothetical protein
MFSDFEESAVCAWRGTSPQSMTMACMHALVIREFLMLLPARTSASPESNEAAMASAQQGG